VVECHHGDVARLPGVIACEGLELRRWGPAFVKPMLSAIETSFAELQQWMSWAQEMPTVDGLRQVLLEGQLAFDADRAWEYAMFERETGQLVGGTGLHPSDRPDCFEIGYWVRTDWTCRGLATAATRALVDAAFSGLDEATQMVIRMDRANLASAAIPPKVGFTLDHEEDRDLLAKAHTGRGFVWIRRRSG
jgi:RimJ/RimL family protein N-acetyltransferase